MKLTVRSTAFEAGARIDRRYTGEGADSSPGLTWSGAPSGTAEFALIMDDPDAPQAEPWVHWVLYKIPPGTTALPEGIAKTEQVSDPAGALQGKNSFGKIGYNGPMPPPGHGTHHYHFRVYALDQALSAAAGLTKAKLLDALRGHILAEGDLVGTYSR
jgi:Raf kinase inhibitor-like YbhB/YbcL family protein